MVLLCLSARVPPPLLQRKGTRSRRARGYTLSGEFVPFPRQFKQLQSKPRIFPVLRAGIVTHAEMIPARRILKKKANLIVLWMLYDF